MPLSVIALEATLSDILDANSYTLGELSSHPLAVPYVTKFDAFQTDWFTTNTARIQLEIAAGKAQGAVAGADSALDDFVDTLDRTVLIAVKNDRTAPLYQLYFGLKAPSLLKRPILSDELTTCRAWIPSLQASPLAPVAALAPTLVTVVAAADAAVAQKLAADQAVKDFDTIGAKKALIDEYNALRKTAYGELAAMPHQNPTAMLPASFADRFFPHDAHTGVTSLTNPKDVQAKIDALNQDLATAQGHLGDLTTKAATKAAQKKAEADAATVLAQAKKDEAAARQKTKDAEKAAKDAKKKPPPAAPPAAPAAPTPPKGAVAGKPPSWPPVRSRSSPDPHQHHGHRCPAPRPVVGALDELRRGPRRIPFAEEDCGDLPRSRARPRAARRWRAGTCPPARSRPGACPPPPPLQDRRRGTMALRISDTAASASVIRPAWTHAAATTVVILRELD